MLHDRTKTEVIYQPKGAAREYAELAVNLCTGCVHGCKYCYVPKTLRLKPEVFHASPRIKKHILQRLEADAEILRRRPEPVPEILLCFACDPYQTAEVAQLTHEALVILGERNLKATVLTKNAEWSMRDFSTMEKYGHRFGISLVWIADLNRMEWEPGAPGCFQRQRALISAKTLFNLKTWVSLEPVIDPEEALAVIEELHPWVDEWRIGKINHHPELEKQVDWGDFRRCAENLLNSLGAAYHFKSSLSWEKINRRNSPPPEGKGSWIK